MPLLSRRIPYDRKVLMRNAEASNEKRRYRRAARLYGQILAAEPNNPEIHYRIAPLLARTGHAFEAWESFRIAAQSPEIAERSAQTVALYRTASELMPRHLDAWRELSRSLLADQRPKEALEALRNARPNFRGRRRRGEAIALLRSAHELDPWNPDIVLDLCRLLGKRGRKAEALFLLDELDRRVDGRVRRRARGLSWRLDPTFGQTWRWFKSAWDAHRAEQGNAAFAVRSRS